MGTKSTTINSQHPRTNQGVEVILKDQYIIMGRHGMEYTIGDQRYVNDIQRKLMG